MKPISIVTNDILRLICCASFLAMASMPAHGDVKLTVHNSDGESSTVYMKDHVTCIVRDIKDPAFQGGMTTQITIINANDQTVTEANSDDRT
jgi:hypothetical protein